MDIEEIRKDFPILGTMRNGKYLAYLDSAATSQKPNAVIDAISDYYRNYNANIHRGLYDISMKATDAYVHSKELVSEMINAGSYRNIIYCRNTTEAINLAALTWAEEKIHEGDHILITKMEHHSNIVPWQLLVKRKKAVLDYVEVDDSFKVDMEDYAEKVSLGPKLVSFTHVSNVLGSINDAKKMTSMAHGNGAVVLVDGAQSVPHIKVDVRDIGCDFFAFSSHKMLGPAVIGVLYGKEEILEEIQPALGGGDMIRSVDFDESTWNELPWKFEAGTPNIEGGIGLGAAVEYLKKVGIENIRKHELDLTAYALKRFEEDKGITVYGIRSEGMESGNRAGVISFNIEGAHPHDTSTIFDSENIAIRAGHHCAMPLVNKVIGVPAVARMSFYLYNKEEEVDRVIEAVEKVRKVLRLGRKA